MKKPRGRMSRKHNSLLSEQKELTQLLTNNDVGPLYHKTGTAILQGYETTDFILSKAERILKISKSFPPSKSIDMVDDRRLYSLLAEISILDMTVRSGILGGRNKEFVNREKRLVDNTNIIVCKPENALLRVALPPLVGRRYRGSYNIYWKLKSALNQYERQEGIEHVVSGKLVLLYKQYTRSLEACQTCDNDNWEMRRTTNAITEALNYSDILFCIKIAHTSICHIY